MARKMATVAQLLTPGGPDRRRTGALARPGRVRVLLALVPDRPNRWFASLRTSRYDVVLVNDTDAALDALDDGDFDLMLLDLALPEAIETAQLHRFLSLDRRSLQIIGLTARGMELNERHRRTLDMCLPIDAGPAALEALESLFLHHVRQCPEAGTPSVVVSFASPRPPRPMPG
jgi:CheY-like chemotaxis protein